MENAEKQGRYLKTSLSRLMQTYEALGDVRGMGLMVGAELVKDRNSKVPDREARDAVIQKAFQKGLLLLGCGENSIRFSPALTVAQEEIDTCLSLFEEALHETVK